MIITIICAVLFIIDIFIYKFVDKETAIYTMIIKVAASIILVVICGYAIKPDYSEKIDLEKMLEITQDSYVIEKAQEYNYSVNEYNNYFFRFTIEDRSEWLIDINKYLGE